MHAAYVPSYEGIEGSVCQVTALMAEVTCSNSGHWTKCNRVREGVQANHDQDGHDQEVSDLEEGIHLAVGLEGLSARPVAAQVMEGSGYGLVVGRISFSPLSASVT